ncbi:C4-dicarboxylate ABC transporter, partial [Rhizobium johnstonii]
MLEFNIMRAHAGRLSMSTIACILLLCAGQANAETLRLAHASGSKSLIHEAVVMGADKLAGEIK